MNRLDLKKFLTPGVLIPAALALAGITLIVIGQMLSSRPPESGLPDITPPPPTSAPPTASPDATVSPDATATPAAPSPYPDDVVAEQLQIEAVGINVGVLQSQDAETDDFPPADSAFILSGGAQPGRNTNSFVFAHALENLFKPLWNVRIGDEVLVQMSNGDVLTYRITEVRPNTPCPDPGAEAHPYPPLALQRAGEDCDVSWLNDAPEERLTLQTSQGFNRNWGELIVIAEPVR